MNHESITIGLQIVQFLLTLALMIFVTGRRTGSDQRGGHDTEARVSKLELPTWHERVDDDIRTLQRDSLTREEADSPHGFMRREVAERDRAELARRIDAAEAKCLRIHPGR